MRTYMERIISVIEKEKRREKQERAFQERQKLFKEKEKENER